jgi:hypothetical protein
MWTKTRAQENYRREKNAPVDATKNSMEQKPQGFLPKDVQEYGLRLSKM